MGDLSDFIADVTGESVARVEENFGAGYVRLVVDEAERRQARHDIRCVEDVVVELLRNARDAGATQIYLATTRQGDERHLTMIDDGSGVPLSMQERIFEARVTSKLDSIHEDRWGVHGRGMALFSIRQNARIARVRASGERMGTSIEVITGPELPERADQSTWPTLFTTEDDETTVARGPHNIPRTCCEFAFEERHSVTVFLGSPAEIVVTIRSRMASAMDDASLLFLDSIDSLPLLERLYAAVDAKELVEVASSLGLELSERTAHRILSGAIRPVRSVMARLTHGTDKGQTSSPVDLSKDQRGLKLDEGDSKEFSRRMERAFSFISDRYYVALEDEPTVRCGKNKITVTFRIAKEDEG